MKILPYIFFALFISGIATAQGEDSSPPTTAKKIVTGTASFYSANLHGSKTSNGEIFSNGAMTAASNSFKLNTWVRVTNLRNKRSVVVRITDHMHKRMAKKGRVIDLSIIAAKKLNFIKKGITTVQVYEVEKPNK